LSFNRVVIFRDGSSQEMTVEGFLALPLPERVRCILGKQILFFCDSAPIHPRQAFAELRVAKSAAASLETT